MLCALLLQLFAVSPAQVADIEHDQAKANAALQLKHGNMKPSELSLDERRALIREQAAAEKQILEKHGVSEKEWALGKQRQSRDERAQVKAAGEALKAKDQADAENAAKPKEERAVHVQKGFSDENPVVLEEKEGTVAVERELPPDAKADLEAAAAADQAQGATPRSSEKSTPSKAPTSRAGHHR
jgi:hypothetical protein